MLTINKTIFNLLSSTTYGTKIYFNVVPEKVQLPVTVIDRSLTTEWTKDGLALVNNSIILTIMGTTYTQTLDIATECNNRLNNYHGSNILTIRLVSTEENFTEDCFKQILTYEALTH